jgi:hypothetical protein
MNLERIYEVGNTSFYFFEYLSLVETWGNLCVTLLPGIWQQELLTLKIIIIALFCVVNQNGIKAKGPYVLCSFVLQLLLKEKKT